MPEDSGKTAAFCSDWLGGPTKTIVMFKISKKLFQHLPPPPELTYPLKHVDWKTNYFPFDMAPFCRSHSFILGWGGLVTCQVGPKKTFTLPETNSSPLKMDGWNMILSYRDSAYFQVRLLLVSGRVSFFLFFVWEGFSP